MDAKESPRYLDWLSTYRVLRALAPDLLPPETIELCYNYGQTLVGSEDPTKEALEFVSKLGVSLVQHDVCMVCTLFGFHSPKLEFAEFILSFPGDIK